MGSGTNRQHLSDYIFVSLDYTDYIILPDGPGLGQSSSAPAILTSFSPNVSVSVGERAVLSCRVAHTSRNTVSWIRHSATGKLAGGVQLPRCAHLAQYRLLDTSLCRG
jgi:hypothetical protein